MTMKWLNEKICEEIEGAECYIKKALKCKDNEKPRHAEIFNSMAKQELEHAEHLMEMAKELYENNESEMSKDLWEYLMNKSKEEYEEVKYYMAVYKM